MKYLLNDINVVEFIFPFHVYNRNRVQSQILNHSTPMTMCPWAACKEFAIAIG